MPRRHTGRGVLATALLAGAAVAQPQASQPQPQPKDKPQPGLPDLPAIPEFKPKAAGPSPRPAPAAVQAAIVPDAEGSLAAFSAVQAWVKAWSTDPKPELAAPKVAAASVTLRYLGEPIGRGTDTGADETTIARATWAALREASQRLPVPDDALRQQRLKELAAQFTISLELAGPAVPVREATFDDIDLALSPGIDGVAVRLSNTVEVAFPGAMLATRGTPSDSAAALAGRVLGDPAKALRVDPTAQPAILREKYGVVISRFRTTHLAQTAPGKPPIFLHRGQRVVETREMTTAALKEMSAGIARHLLSRLEGTQTPIVRGTYDPTRGVWDPPVASVVEQSLMAYAAYEHDRRIALPGEDQKQKFWLSIQRLTEGEDAFKDPMVAAAVWLGCFAAHPYVEKTIDRAKAASAGETTNPVLRSLRLAAYAKDFTLGSYHDGMPHVQKHNNNVAAMLKESTASELVSTLPWALVARVHPGKPLAAEDPSAAKLREMRELIYANVLTADDAGEDGRDMIGGIVFPGSRQPMPTAQSARVIAGLALLLSDERVTPRDQARAELVRLLPCLRFLRQLCADESESWMYRDPAAARWGVRGAVWDQRMSGEALALALVAVDTTLAQIDDMAKWPVKKE